MCYAIVFHQYKHYNDKKKIPNVIHCIMFNKWFRAQSIVWSWALENELSQQFYPKEGDLNGVK